MKPVLIAHRGNTCKIEPERENSPEYIDEAIAKEYDVEVDVRMKDGGLYLGHDYPQHYIHSYDWLISREKKLWIHCKDFESLSLLIGVGLRIFYHSKEDHTIINNTNLIWSHDFIGRDNVNCIIPLLSLEDVSLNLMDNGKFGSTVNSAYGICSDYVDTIKGLL